MNRRRLTDEESALLLDSVARHAPDLVGLATSAAVRPLTLEEANELRGAVLSEFCYSGLGEDSEPNDRGLRLEDLIDKLGRLADWSPAGPAEG